MIPASPEAKQAAQDDEGRARAHLRDVASLYRISAEEIDALPMRSMQRFPGGGAVVRFRNEIDGIEVFREEVNVLLDTRGELVAIGGFAMGAPFAARKASNIAREDAIARGARRLRLCARYGASARANARGRPLCVVHVAGRHGRR